MRLPTRQYLITITFIIMILLWPVFQQSDGDAALPNADGSNNVGLRRVGASTGCGGARKYISQLASSQVFPP
jgi:hypothetical protein